MANAHPRPHVEQESALGGWALPGHLDGPLLIVVRVVWLGLAFGLVALVTVGFVRGFRDPALMMPPALGALFRTYGLDDHVMMVIALVAPYVTVVLIAALLFVRRSRDPMALVFMLALLAAYSFTSRTLLTYAGDPVLRHAVSAVLAIMMVCLALVLVTFPDGRLAPRWGGWVVPATVGLVVAFPDSGRALMALVDGVDSGSARTRLLVALYGLVLLLGLLAQVHRYRHVSGPAQRQQAKWVMAPLGVFMVLSVATLTVSAILPPASALRWTGWLLGVSIPLGVLVPIAVANAVLRYRLYEIDRIISRTVSYGLVVLVLGAVYGLGVVGFGAAVSALTGERSSDLTVAVSVLAAAALFRPLRRRIQTAVDRRFHRTGHEARLVVDAYRRQVREGDDLPTMVNDLAAAASAAVKPAHMSIWLADDPVVASVRGA